MDDVFHDLVYKIDLIDSRVSFLRKDLQLLYQRYIPGSILLFKLRQFNNISNNKEKPIDNAHAY